MHFYVSLWNYLYYSDSKSLDEVLGEIAAHDFGVELWPAVHSFDPYRPAYHPSFPCAEGFDQIYDLFHVEHRERLRDALGGMRSCWHSRAFDDDPKNYADFDAYMLEIDAAASLGSEAISVHYLGEELTTRGFTGRQYDFVHNVLGYATNKGVSMALETWDYESLQRAVGKFSNLSVCLDPACIHSNSSHSLEDFIGATADRISFLHLYDTKGTTSHLTPGCGEIPLEDWKCLWQFVRESDFQGPAVLEIRPPSEKNWQTPIEAAVEARNFFNRVEDMIN